MRQVNALAKADGYSTPSVDAIVKSVDRDAKYLSSQSIPRKLVSKSP